MAESVSVAAPAKVNLALHVTGRRDDGYHLLETLVVFTELGDRITASRSDADHFVMTGRFAGDVPDGDGNLVLKARDAFRASCSGRFPDAIDIKLEKNLPVAAGIGGGSSDAAATLRALAQLAGINSGDARLLKLAASLGADLPMCLTALPLIARGTGDILEPVQLAGSMPMVLVNPGIAVPTAEIFRALRSRDNAPLRPLPDIVDYGALIAWLKDTRNDLFEPARRICPEIDAVLARLSDGGALLARMSGSGATCFGLFETDMAARRAAENLSLENPGWFVAATYSLQTREADHVRN